MTGATLDVVNARCPSTWARINTNAAWRPAAREGAGKDSYSICSVLRLWSWPLSPLVCLLIARSWIYPDNDECLRADNCDDCFDDCDSGDDRVDCLVSNLDRTSMVVAMRIIYHQSYLTLLLFLCIFFSGFL